MHQDQCTPSTTQESTASSTSMADGSGTSPAATATALQQQQQGFAATPTTSSPSSPSSTKRLREEYKVYHLELRDGFHYVGMTSRSLEERLGEHHDGDGAEWTKIHPPKSSKNAEIVGNSFQDDQDAVMKETRVTIELMRKYGTDKVRGGVFANVELNERQMREIDALIKTREREERLSPPRKQRNV